MLLALCIDRHRSALLYLMDRQLDKGEWQPRSAGRVGEQQFELSQQLSCHSTKHMANCKRKGLVMAGSRAVCPFKCYAATATLPQLLHLQQPAAQQSLWQLHLQ